MQVLVKVHYTLNTIEVLRRCDLKVNPRLYKDNPDKAAAEVAMKWIGQLKREASTRLEVTKVLYNTTDITDLIKEAPL